MQPSKEQLLEQIQQLQQEVNTLRQERDDLELLLETTMDHSDVVEEELHHKAEQALRRSEQQLRMIVAATPVPVLITRLEDGRILYANATAGPMFGLSAEDLLQHYSTDFYQDLAGRQQLMEALQRDGEVNAYEQSLNKADGTPFWAEISLRHLTFDDIPSLLVAIHDITERKQAAQALQAAVDNLTQTNQASSRFVPGAFLDFLQKQSISDIRLGDHFSHEMTVMFSDLRSFTAISENMTAQENFDFVNAYLGKVSPMVREHRGFIVKYLGDGMMAIFPEQPDDALRAGIAKLQQIEQYNLNRQQKGRLPIKIGIGVNTGHMMVGIVGDTDRMQGDALSDHVNLTSRVEGLTKFYGVSFIITKETYQLLQNPDQYGIRFIDKVQVMGKSKVLELYEVFEADSAEQCQLKQDTLADYEQALQLYYQQEFEQAQARLFGVLQKNPKDKVAWHHLVQVTRLLEQGIDGDWIGVTVMATK